MTAVVAHHALGQAGGAGGVEDIEGVGGGDGDAGMGLGGGQGLVPIEVAAGDHGPGFLGTLQHQATLGLVVGHLDGLIQQRLVMDHPVRLDAAGGRDDHLGLGVVDAGGQFAGGEAAEDHGVDGAEAGAGQHGDGRLGDHGHVDDDAVALDHAQVGEGAGAAGDLVQQLGVGDGLRWVPVTGLS
jgi:hypothetical protein